jgi:hypothetical protein
VAVGDGYCGIQDMNSCEMMHDKRKLFVEFIFMCLFMLVRMLVRMRVFTMVAFVAVEHKDTSHNIKKVVDKKGDTRMNYVVHIVIIIVVRDK